MSDWSSRNAFKPSKPRNDLIVLERGGDLVVRKRWRRRKPRQAVERVPYAVMPPPKPKSIIITTTRTTNLKVPPPERFERSSFLKR
jgi:hypothetical protein